MVDRRIAPEPAKAEQEIGSDDQTTRHSQAVPDIPKLRVCNDVLIF